MKIRNGLKVAIAAGAIVSAIAGPALADQISIGGGTWNYGAGSQVVWSNYHHPSVCHGSTAVGQYTVRSPDTAAGYWSYASAPVKVSGNNAYYRTTCS